MKKTIRGIGALLGLNSAFVVLCVLFAMNRGLADEMMSLVVPMLLITSGALIYTRYFDGDITTAMSAALLLEIGQMTQVLIHGDGGITLQSKILLCLTPIIGAIGVVFVSWLETRDFYDKHRGKKYLWITAGLIIFITLLLLLFGKNINGTKAWMSIFGISLQLTEFLKPLYIVYHAVLWSSSVDRSKRFPLSASLTVIVSLMLLLINELGTLLVILLLWIILNFVYSDKLIHSVIGLCGSVMAILSGYGVLFVIHSRVVKSNEMGEDINGIFLRLNMIYKKLHDRIMIVFDEEQLLSNADYRRGEGYQFYKAREMILKGGLLGTTSNTNVPVEKSDYAFVGLILRCGIIFAIIVLVLFFLIFYRSMIKSVSIENKFESILLTGTSLSLILPTFINVMGTTNFGFMTGIAIPFISYGGTNMLLTMFSIMLLLWGTCSKRPGLTRHISPNIYDTDDNKNKSEEVIFTR